MEKKYQVFVSSTYEDLIDERKEVMQALLEMDCIPCGMELFPAANDEQWTVIKRIIDECDYYILILGGRYGTIGPDGIGYTEKEYRYALEKEKPGINFIYKEPENLPVKKCERTPDGKKKYDEFKTLAQKKLCKYWNNSENLGSVVSRGIINLIKNNPAIGLVKADKIVNSEIAQEILYLRKENDELKERIKLLELAAPIGSEQYAQGNDTILLEIHFIAWIVLNGDPIQQDNCSINFRFTWNDLFGQMAPYMIIDESEDRIKKHLEEYFVKKVEKHIRSNTKFAQYNYFENYYIDNIDFNTLLIQYRALGYIEHIKTKDDNPGGKMWHLSTYGDYTMMQIRAIKKNS